MHIRIQHLLFAALVISLVSLAYGINYMYLTDIERTVFGERIKLFHGDTLQGNIHSNDTIAIMEDPQFYGRISTCAPYFIHDSGGYNPGFHGPCNVVFNADSVHIPSRAEELRHCAGMQWSYYSMPGRSYRMYLRGDSALICRWPQGTPFDSSDSWSIAVSRGHCVFFEGPLEIQGHMTGELSVGCSQSMVLLDNVLYDDANPHTGVVPLRCGNYLMLVSEGDIKVGNTPANGRWNSHGRGLNQTNPDSTTIVITAALVALNESFTFSQQNDPDSGYVYQNPEGVPAQDDRGYIYLYGSLTQKRRGYVHRATNGSTGYLKNYHWDFRFASWDPPGILPFDTHPFHTTDTLDFGNVPMGQTAWDTAHIYVDMPSTLGSVLTNSPFWATRTAPFTGDSFAIPVSFTPTHATPYSGLLYVSTTYHYFQIPVKGRGMPGGAPPLVFDVSPNPFNLTTTLRFSLSQASIVKLKLFDVLGRTARQMDLSVQEPGEHSVRLDASDLASGVYFVHLRAQGQSLTKKVLLLK